MILSCKSRSIGFCHVEALVREAALGSGRRNWLRSFAEKGGLQVLLFGFV